MTSFAVIVPFRDRGTDVLRGANLKRVLDHWSRYDVPVVVADDGRTGKAHFNRSAAYNKGTAQTNTDVLVYSESDMLIPFSQIREAVQLAAEWSSLIVPFGTQKKLSHADSILVRARQKDPANCEPVEYNTSNYGCVNVIHRDTIKAVGKWDETFEGNAHDDAAMWRAFDIVGGPTGFVSGPAYHLYHRESRDPADKTVTERNYRRMQLYMQAATPEEIRHLTGGGQSLGRDWRGKLR
jgi:hypothetical protein